MFNKKKNKISIPTEFRRTPFYKRLPEWFGKQVNGLRRGFGIKRRTKNPSYRPLPKRMQQGFERSLNKSFVNTAWLVRRLIRIRIRLWILVPISFLLGAAISYGVMKQRRAANDVILSVESTRITEPEFLHRMEIQVGAQTLNTMVQEELNLRFAESRHLLPTQAQVQARVKQIKMQPGYDRLVQQKHLTDADIERQALVQLAVEALYTQHISVTEDEARAYYASNVDASKAGSLFYVPDAAYLSVITNTLESNIQKANQELAQGKSFSAVAKTYSQDLTGGIPGKMPAIWRGRTQFAREPALENEIFKTQPGQRIGPIRFFNTWWIIRVDKLEPARTLPYGQVRQQCLAGAKYMKAIRTNQPQLEADVTEFRKKTKIQIFWEHYYYDLTGQRR